MIIIMKTLMIAITIAIRHLHGALTLHKKAPSARHPAAKA